MSEKRGIDEYIKQVSSDLTDVSRTKREKVLSRIRQHIKESTLERRYEADGGSVNESYEGLVQRFGDPNDIAATYRMQMTDKVEKESKKKQTLIALFVVLTLVLSFFIVVFFSFGDGDDNGDIMEEGVIYPGIGIYKVQIGDPGDLVYGEFGDPEERIETENTIWLSYRNSYGIDFLVANGTGEVIEIRFQEGYDGELEVGVSVGDPLQEVFDEISAPREIYDTNYSQTHESVYGGYRILYRQLGEDGNITSYKYIDNEKGVLFWADEKEEIIQIVIFKT